MGTSPNLVTLTTDPAWSIPAIAAAALALVGLTLWTYRGVQEASRRRVLTVLSLRLAALLLAVLALLRPSLAFHDDQRIASKVLVGLDYSESMTIQDEFDNLSRWGALQRTLEKCTPVIDWLRSEHQIDIVFYQFAGDVRAYDPQSPANGKRSDYGQLLDRLYRDHSHERFLRCLIVAGDGADNGTRIQPMAVAPLWRNLPCPVHTFGFGKPTTSDQQNDIAVTGIVPEPPPPAIKGDAAAKSAMTVRATVDAPGFANAPVNVRLLIDGKEVPIEKMSINGRDVTGERQTQFPLTSGNQLQLQCSAPPDSGEYKLTLRIDPLPGEVSTANNEISTFFTVAKEGLSVLLVDKARFPEPQLLIDALRKDPRIRVHAVWLRRDQALEPQQLDLFQFDRQHYDVIILGDVSAARLAQGGPQVLEKIKELVDKRSTGLLMMGGYDSFGNSDWQQTDIAKLLPVRLEPGQVERQLKMEPTDAGLRHYVLRLDDRPTENEARWKQLPPLDGMTRLGTPKEGAIVYAKASTGEPMLVGQTYGSGRVLAFGADTTHRWTRNPDGLYSHHRFWKQLVLWLAKQEESEGSAWAKLDTRRLPAGSQVGFTVGLRGKGGVDLPDAQFEVKVIGPDGAEAPVPTARDKAEERGSFWKTDAPGEYRLVVKASGKDADGTPAAGEAAARFLVYEDTAELTIRRADHDFLKKLAAQGGGQFHRPDELKEFLQQLALQPLPQLKPKAALWPEWRQNSLSPFLAGFFLLFVAVLCLEWFLRRRWGMV
jgi:uncharacterized membrane protein